MTWLKPTVRDAERCRLWKERPGNMGNIQTKLAKFTRYVEFPNTLEKISADRLQWNKVGSKSTLHHDVASTLILRYFDFMCLLELYFSHIFYTSQAFP